jgi:hypothetical protein
MINSGKASNILIFSLAVIVLASFFVGCARTVSTDPLDKQVAGTPSDQVPLIPEKITIVSDLPAPARMKIKKSASHSYEGSGTRTVNYTYEGWVDIRRVHRFYLDQMPLSNWQLLSNNYDRGAYTLTFQKGTEICTVIIRKNIVFMTVARLLIETPQTIR